MWPRHALIDPPPLSLSYTPCNMPLLCLLNVLSVHDMYCNAPSPGHPSIADMRPSIGQNTSCAMDDFIFIHQGLFAVCS